MEEPKQPGLGSLWFLDILALLEPIEQFTNEIKRISALQPLDFPERMTIIQEACSTLSREVQARFETYAKQLEERKKELQNILNPPKLDLIEQILRLFTELSEGVQKVKLREELMKRWEAESPEVILHAYEDSLAAGETDTAEMFEAYAEDILKRKGNEASVAAFRERQERARDLRLTPEQLRAKQELQVLERLGTSIQAIFSGIVSGVKFFMSSENDPPLPDSKSNLTVH